MAPAVRHPGFNYFRLGMSSEANERRLKAGQPLNCPPSSGFPPVLMPYVLGSANGFPSSLNYDEKIGKAEDRYADMLSQLGKRQQGSGLGGMDPDRYTRHFAGTTQNPVQLPMGCYKPGLFRNPLTKLTQHASLLDLFFTNQRTEMQIVAIALFVFMALLAVVEAFTAGRNLRRMWKERPRRRKEAKRYRAWKEKRDQEREDTRIECERHVMMEHDWRERMEGFYEDIKTDSHASFAGSTDSSYGLSWLFTLRRRALQKKIERTDKDTESTESTDSDSDST